MTLVERLASLYDADPSPSGVCQYCCEVEHDELCVWRVTQEAIAVLRGYEDGLARIETRLDRLEDSAASLARRLRHR